MMRKFEVLIPDDILSVLQESFSDDEIAIVINQTVRRDLEEWRDEHVRGRESCQSPPCPVKPAESDDVNSQEWTR